VNGRMNWNGRSEVEARDVLSMVKNNWRGKEEKEKRREEKRRRRERGNGFHRVGEDRMIVQMDFNGLGSRWW
jgi:RecB family exonuclease